MRYYIITDLEGVVGVDAWRQTRTAEDDFDEEGNAAAKAQLAREVNACIAGIHDRQPDATVDVLDGHGSGGLEAEALSGGNYLRTPDVDPFEAHDYDAMLYVGQHAMAGMPFAPLNHTQSSLHREYYKLNGTFIGEFAGGAIRAGINGVPTIYLAGDDKACLEAQMFVPEIETTAVKQGTGVQSAVHMDPDEACDRIREEVKTAIDRVDEIPPLAGFEPPYTMEIRFTEERDEVPDRFQEPNIDVTRVDPYTFRVTSDRFSDVYP